MLAWLKRWADQHFVDDWRQVWRCASSVKLGAVVAVVAGVVVEFPTLLLFLYTLGPGRSVLAVGTVLMVYAIVVYFRLRKDKSLETPEG